MKKKMVKVTLNGSGQTLILDLDDFNELNTLRHILCWYSGETGYNLQLEVSYKTELPIEKTCVVITPIKKGTGELWQDESKFIAINQLGVFSDHVDPGSGDVFTLELIEMDEKEIAALPEFVGWLKWIMK